MVQQLLDEAPAHDKVADNGGPPGLARKKSEFLIAEMKKQVGSKRRRFLVAKLNTSSHPDVEELMRRQTAAPEVSNTLVDSRLHFQQSCLSKHWQYNELRRAHYATMMMLATLGGRPTLDEHALLRAEQRV